MVWCGWVWGCVHVLFQWNSFPCTSDFLLCGCTAFRRSHYLRHVYFNASEKAPALAGENSSTVPGPIHFIPPSCSLASEEHPHSSHFLKGLAYLICGTGYDLSLSSHRPKDVTEHLKLFGTSLQKHINVSNCPRQKGLLTERDMAENTGLGNLFPGDSGQIRE